MSVVDEFRGYTPKEVAEMTRLYGEHELRRLAAASKIAHHRGAMNRVIFFPDDIKDLLSSTRRNPTDQTAPAAPALAVAAEPEDDDPFRSTPRSRALHSARRA